MKQILLKFLRSKMFQPFWGKLNHIALIGMNYFGGASLQHSGEISVIHWAKEKLKEKKNIVIFDVGANTGDYALLANRVFDGNAEIFAFEPSEFTFNQLKSKSLAIHEIKIFNLGIGIEKSSLKLFSAGKGRTTASVYNLKYKRYSFVDEFSEDIELTSIDLFCLEHNIYSIDMLKIDIEGHELAAIQGARKMIKSGAINFIQFEFGRCHIDAKVFFRDFYDLLNPDFKLYRIVSDGLFEIKSYNSSQEIFQTANFLAENRNINKC